MPDIYSEEEHWLRLRDAHARAKGLVIPILTARNGVDPTHSGDIFATLASRHPEVIPTAALLNDEDAAEYLREQLRLLEADDPELFRLAPSREDYARLIALALQGAKWRDLSGNTQAHYWTQSDLTDVNGRRRSAYKFRQIIAAREARAKVEASS